MFKRSEFRSKVGFVLLVCVGLLVVFSAGVFAGGGGVITACVQHSTGKLRVVTSPSACHPDENVLTWNQTGPAGPPGPQGPPGPAGASNALAVNREFSGPFPIGPDYTTVVTENVPQGFYVFIAKVVVSTDTSTGSDCRLTFQTPTRPETEVDHTSQVPASGSASARATHNLERLLQFGTSSATVRLSCRAGEPWFAFDARIIAIQVQNASDSVATG